MRERQAQAPRARPQLQQRRRQRHRRGRAVLRKEISAEEHLVRRLRRLEPPPRLAAPARRLAHVAAVVRERREKRGRQRRVYIACRCFLEQRGSLGTISGGVGAKGQRHQSARFAVAGHVGGAKIVTAVDDAPPLGDHQQCGDERGRGNQHDGDDPAPGTPWPARRAHGRRAGGDGVVQIVCELASVGVSILRLLLQTTCDEAAEQRREVVERRRVAQHGRVHFDVAVAVERHRSGQHLVRDAAEGEEVAGRRGRFAAELLGRHVAGRAQ